MAFSLIGCSHIKPIKSFNEADFSIISEDTLVIFDVDETLIQPLDSYLINEHTEQGKNFRNQIINKYRDVENWDNLTAVMLLNGKRPLLEPNIINRIQKLKDRKVKFIALSHMNTGKLDFIDELAEWRYEHLKSLGFESNFGNNIILNVNFHNRKPLFYKGILATDLNKKGPILVAFLNQINYYPENVIMFDDNLDYLESVETSLKPLNIKFFGYHYLGAKTKPWNQKIIDYQVDYLIRYRKWLDDDQVQNKLNNM
ncbi:MAG: DUF2608 domain-containing protein [Alphaproteobacteria bacterium]|nr:DUF2608 domain-containing protein [Alphaproteobacteria bacterium]